jgi:hypothetical protein
MKQITGDSGSGAVPGDFKGQDLARRRLSLPQIKSERIGDGARQ